MCIEKIKTNTLIVFFITYCRFLNDKKKGVKSSSKDMIPEDSEHASLFHEKDVGKRFELGGDDDSDEDIEKKLYVHEKIAFGEVVERPPQLNNFFASKGESKKRSWESLAATSMLQSAPLKKIKVNGAEKRRSKEDEEDPTAAARKRILEVERKAAVEGKKIHIFLFTLYTLCMY